MLKKGIVVLIISLLIGFSFVSICESLRVKKRNVSNDIITYIIETDSGNTIYVDDDWEQDDPPNHKWNTIQEAIDDAVDGDTVYVYNGTYYENIKVNKSLNLIGENRETTIIDGSVNKTVTIFSNSIIFTEFTVQNEFVYPWGGIGFYIFGNNHIIKNNIIQGHDYGIKFDKSSNSIIIDNNSIFENHVGINTGCAQKIIIKNNRIYNNLDIGLWIVCSENLDVVENDFKNGSGIFIDGNELDMYLHNIEGNFVNDKKLCYYKNMNGFEISSDFGQIILVNCQDVKIDRVNIEKTDPAIEIAYSENIEILNSFFTDNKYGILMFDSSNCKIIDNTCINSDASGIHLFNCHNMLLKNNNLFNGFWGCYIYGNNNIIKKSKLNSNYYIGLEVSGSLNQIYHNFFFNNGHSAYGYGMNQWDNGIYGNYWSDFEEKYPHAKKLSLKGIWDTPYEIPGDGDNQDNYPLLKPYGRPRGKSDNSIINRSSIELLQNYHVLYQLFLRFLKI